MQRQWASTRTACLRNAPPHTTQHPAAERPTTAHPAHRCIQLLQQRCLRLAESRWRLEASLKEHCIQDCCRWAAAAAQARQLGPQQLTTAHAALQRSVGGHIRGGLLPRGRRLLLLGQGCAGADGQLGQRVKVSLPAIGLRGQELL